MILIDYNQIALGALMVTLKRGQELSDDLVRHIVLNNIRYYRSRFSEKYSDIVICCDNKQYWRRLYFEHYKANRKKDREASGHDWDAIFTVLNSIRDELREFFPYKVLDVTGAEADDIIATLVFNNTKDKHIIISSDKDFIQLHTHKVQQYSPLTKKMLKNKNPKVYLQEHILKGDSGDGVPNILSSDDTFVTDKRQKPLRKVIIQEVLDSMNDWAPKDLFQLAKCNKDTWIRNWQRNETLIDLRKCPSTISADIQKDFREYKLPDRKKLFNYFVDKKLTTLIESIGDF